jgi:hypothetical protein
MLHVMMLYDAAIMERGAVYLLTASTHLIA